MVTRDCLKAVGGFNANYKYAMDGDLFFNIAVSGYKGAWLPEITTVYRIHSSSVSHRKRLEQLNEISTIFDHYIQLEILPLDVQRSKKVYCFFTYILFAHVTAIDGYLDEAVRYANMTIDAVWFSRPFTIYDLATYLSDSMAFRAHPISDYQNLISVVRRVFPSPDETRLSSRLAIDTHTLLAWWLCIWWRYYHYMTPENANTDPDRYSTPFTPYCLDTYGNKSAEEIIHLARIAILISPVLSDKTLAAINLFWQEMADYGILSDSDHHHIIDLYFALAIRALYMKQSHYAVQALQVAIRATHPQSIRSWLRFGKSLVGFVARQLMRQ